MKQILTLLIFAASSTLAFSQKICALSTYEAQIIAGNPQLQKNYNAIENFTRLTLTGSNAASSIQSAQEVVPSVITIPVVVHVLYNNTLQNISDAQIQSQIDALNRDFRGTNADRMKTPAYFAGVSADAGFEFRLARIDPNGYATSGIIRKQTSIQMFGLDDRIKSGAIGGDEGWNSKNYLNIWVGNLVSGILGYTSKTGGPSAMDGVVINYAAFGTMGTAGAPFNLGRTATHEIGHWLNLRHIWGDAYCGDDEVDDTPQQRGSNTGCPQGEKFSCGTTPHGDMYMNFMDLTNDACMYMFTKGQALRMRALFAAGGPRHDMLSSNALTGTPIVRLVPTAAQATAPATSSALQLSVYPNPAETFIVVSINGDENLAGKPVTIYNSIGQPVITTTMAGNKVSIDVSRLAAGVYFIRQVNGAMARFVKK